MDHFSPFFHTVLLQFMEVCRQSLTHIFGCSLIFQKIKESSFWNDNVQWWDLKRDVLKQIPYNLSELKEFYKEEWDKVLPQQYERLEIMGTYCSKRWNYRPLIHGGISYWLQTFFLLGFGLSLFVWDCIWLILILWFLLHLYTTKTHNKIKSKGTNDYTNQIKWY